MRKDFGLSSSAINTCVKFVHNSTLVGGTIESPAAILVFDVCLLFTGSRTKLFALCCALRWLNGNTFKDGLFGRNMRGVFAWYLTVPFFETFLLL
jgi:hypothetical protein